MLYKIKECYLGVSIYDLYDHIINIERHNLIQPKGRIRRDEIDNVFLFLGEKKVYTVLDGRTYKTPGEKVLKMFHNGQVFWMKETYVENIL